MSNTPRLVRVNPFTMLVEGNSTLCFKPRVYATSSVPMDRASISALSILDTLSVSAVGIPDGALVDAAFTPDMHKSSTVPVGTILDVANAVFPSVIGGDIGCGMALATLDVTRQELGDTLVRLRPLLRHAFYEGGRDIPMTEEARARILLEGIQGLPGIAGCGGLFDGMNPEHAIAHATSSIDTLLPTAGLWNFNDYVRGSGGLSRDAQIGSLSGGNHFLELGSVSSRDDRRGCHELGLEQDRITLLAHNGSVGLGSSVADHFTRMARHHAGSVMPALDMHKRGDGQAYMHAMALAANFAAVNRVALLWMARDCISRALGRPVTMKPILDCAHNMAWAEERDDGWRVLHRKGAAPAPAGRPLVLPANSSDGTLVYTGLGFDGTHASAPHGTGRIERRMSAHQGDGQGVPQAEVLAQVDTRRLPARIGRVVTRSLNQEAARAYKPLEAVAQTVEQAGIGKRLCRILPMITLKRA